MIEIIRAREEDSMLLSELGKISFIESHSESAAETDINEYVQENYTNEVFKKEICNPENIYHVIYFDNRPAGYSKIIFNVPHKNIPSQNVTKLERIYLLKEFYGLGSGYELLRFNIELSIKNKQTGMWLFVWKENHRAVSFYEKTGFKIIGSHDFKITENHSNPNHQMLLKF